MKDIAPILRSLGLLDSEIKTYRAALEKGPQTVIDLSKLTKLSRQATYVAMEALTARGLMSSVLRGKKRFYAAEHPSKLLAYAKRHQADVADHVNDLERTLPELELQIGGERPVVKVYEGKEGLINVISATLKNREKFMRYSSPAENLINIVPEFLDLYGMKRIELGIKIHTILPSNKSARELINTSPKLYKAVLIPKEHYRFSSDFAVWDNKIGYASIRGKDITSIIIESEEIAENMKNLFDMAYKEGRRIGREEGDLI